MCWEQSWSHGQPGTGGTWVQGSDPEDSFDLVQFTIKKATVAIKLPRHVGVSGCVLLMDDS
jgi:hypothetical protein